MNGDVVIQMAANDAQVRAAFARTESAASAMARSVGERIKGATGGFRATTAAATGTVGIVTVLVGGVFKLADGMSGAAAAAERIAKQKQDFEAIALNAERIARALGDERTARYGSGFAAVAGVRSQSDEALQKVADTFGLGSVANARALGRASMDQIRAATIDGQVRMDQLGGAGFVDRSAASRGKSRLDELLRLERDRLAIIEEAGNARGAAMAMENRAQAAALDGRKREADVLRETQRHVEALAQIDDVRAAGAKAVAADLRRSEDERHRAALENIDKEERERERAARRRRADRALAMERGRDQAGLMAMQIRADALRATGDPDDAREAALLMQRMENERRVADIWATPGVSPLMKTLLSMQARAVGLTPEEAASREVFTTGVGARGLNLGLSQVGGGGTSPTEMKAAATEKNTGETARNTRLMARTLNSINAALRLPQVAVAG